MTSEQIPENFTEPDPNWFRYGAGVIPFDPEIKEVPEGFVVCHSHHELHKIPKHLYIVCFECGHPWTKHTLRKAWRRGYLQDFLTPKYPPGWGRPGRFEMLWRSLMIRVSKIFFCPECIHDF